MLATTFDTHAYIKKLTGKGISEQQAETIVEMVKDVREQDLSTLATKADIRELELRMEAKIAQIDSKISEGSIKIILWVVGFGITQITLMLSLLKLH